VTSSLTRYPAFWTQLLLAPTRVAARVILTDTGTLDLDVPLPDVRGALVMNAHAYAGRLASNDALDIWRLLQAASNSGHTSADWPAGSAARDAAVILHRHFATLSGGGHRAATADRMNQARIRALTAAVVPNPTRT
jgi:hypothetical protein